MRVLFLSFFILIIDQVTKFMVKGGTIPLLNIKVSGMNYGDSINVIGDFFKITFVENPGIAFGIDVNETSKLLLSIFTVVASLGILFYLYKVRKQKIVVRIALAFILGGALGNLVDRMFYGVFYNYAPLFYGKVVDFFNVDFFDFSIFGRTYDRWPIFNIADASVTIGVILLLFFHSGSESEKAKSGEDEIQVIKTGASEGSVETAENSEIINISDTGENGEDNNRKEVTV